MRGARTLSCKIVSSPLQNNQQEDARSSAPRFREPNLVRALNKRQALVLSILHLLRPPLHKFRVDGPSHFAQNRLQRPDSHRRFWPDHPPHPRRDHAVLFLLDVGANNRFVAFEHLRDVLRAIHGGSDFAELLTENVGARHRARRSHAAERGRAARGVSDHDHSTAMPLGHLDLSHLLTVEILSGRHLVEDPVRLPSCSAKELLPDLLLILGAEGAVVLEEMLVGRVEGDEEACEGGGRFGRSGRRRPKPDAAALGGCPQLGPRSVVREGRDGEVGGAGADWVEPDGFGLEHERPSAGAESIGEDHSVESFLPATFKLYQSFLVRLSNGLYRIAEPMLGALLGSVVEDLQKPVGKLLYSDLSSLLLTLHSRWRTISYSLVGPKPTGKLATTRPVVSTTLVPFSSVQAARMDSSVPSSRTSSRANPLMSRVWPAVRKEDARSTMIGRTPARASWMATTCPAIPAPEMSTRAGVIVKVL